MACGGCARRRAAQVAARRAVQENDLFAGRSNLTHRQITARLELYKRRYCKTCQKRYDCDYAMYLECKKGGDAN